MINSAPVFYPTYEEWYEMPPLAYIERIRERGEQAGICKIVPPSDWRPPFSLPSADSLEFKTRVQVSQLIEGRARLRKEFAAKLRKVLFLSGNPLPKDYPATSPVAPAFSGDLLTVFRRICQVGGASHASDEVWLQLASLDVEELDICKYEYARILAPLEERLLRGYVVKAIQPVSSSRTDTTETNNLASEPFPENEAPLERARRESVLAEAKARESMRIANIEGSYARLCADAARGLGGPRLYPVRPASARSPLVVIAVGVRFYKYFEDIQRCMVGTVTSVLPRQPGQTDVVWRIRFRLTAQAAQGLESTHSVGSSWDIEEESEDLAVAIQCGSSPEEATEASLRGVCQLCARANNPERLTFCGECKSRFHTDCAWRADSPAELIDASLDWFCPSCMESLQSSHEQDGDEQEAEVGVSPLTRFLGPKNLAGFGFDDGPNHTLQTYWEKDAEVRLALGLTNTHNMEGQEEYDEEMEQKYWEFMNGRYTAEEITVLYGNDLDTSRIGSGFPRTSDPELTPENAEYARSGWNLNNLPTATGSLLQYLGADISGIIVPWLYLGMTFSSFCWHVEDHNFSSVNYHHRGAPKSWWGVSEGEADAFERVTHDMCPELFEARPDILQGIVTMFDPNEVAQRGVNVYHLIQRPGDIVLTFPRGYHAGFNHGFNVAEAVNFATPGWVKHGDQAVERYASLTKQPVVSHEALVVAVAHKLINDGESMDTAKAISEALRRLIESERALRADAYARGVVPPTTQSLSSANASNLQQWQPRHGAAKRFKNGRERQVLGGVFGDVSRCSECKRFCSVSYARTHVQTENELDLLDVGDTGDLRCLQHARGQGMDQLVETHTIRELEELLEAVDKRIASGETLPNPSNNGRSSSTNNSGGGALRVRVKVATEPPVKIRIAV